MTKAREILKRLEKNLPLPEFGGKNFSPFERLIATILSQNTTDKNAIRAFENLKRKMVIKPEILAKASEKEIASLIRIAGLHKQKARTIKSVSKRILEEFDGDLTPILSMEKEKAREVLISLPGIGRKTADVLLAFHGKHPTFPIDTHVRRVSLRLGLAKSRDYEKMRKELESQFDEKDFLKAHMLLIALGRTYCKARKPLCEECFLNDLCPYGRKAK